MKREVVALYRCRANAYYIEARKKVSLDVRYELGTTRFRNRRHSCNIVFGVASSYWISDAWRKEFLGIVVFL